MCLVENLLIQEVHRNDTLIIVGETGSGKTTREILSQVSKCYNHIFSPYYYAKLIVSIYFRNTAVPV